MMKIMFVGSEATPFAKTGGLADVLGSLPQALASLGHEVSLVLPMHRKIKDQFDEQSILLKEFYVSVHTKEEYVGIKQYKHGNIVVYFIDNDYYFGYRENLYGDFDDGERYGYFSKAVLSMMKVIDYYPDILHLNDWQTGLIPQYLKVKYIDKPYQPIKTLFTIHNIAYQGSFSKGLLVYLDLPNDNVITYDDKVNFLKTGLVTADKLSTVSKTYAEELKYEYFAFGMSPIIKDRQADLVGIMNGLDLDAFDPRKDEEIATPFGLNNYVKGKHQNAEALRKMFHLKPSTKPIVGMVSRLTEAKGFPLVEGLIETFLKKGDCQFVLLGSGDADIQAYFNHLKQMYSKDVGVYFGYSDAIARQIYAGSTFFLMPSRFEPCGLAQLISMRYGTLPIVRETGGLKDSVLPFNRYTHDGTGFSFYEYTKEALGEVLAIAFDVHRNQAAYKTLVKRVMKEDFSWNKSAEQYVKLYQNLMEE